MDNEGYNPGAAEDPTTNPDLKEEHETTAGTAPEPKPAKPEKPSTAHVGD